MSDAPTIAAQLGAKYQPLVGDPVPRRAREPRDYGRDTLCLDRLKTGRYATGIKLIGQRLYHRLVTPPTTLRGSRTLRVFGLGIESVIGSAGFAGPLQRSIGPRVRTELEQDPQVSTAEVSAVETRGADGLVTWRITAKVQSALGPFELVIGVDEGLTAELLSLEPLYQRPEAT